MLKVLERELVNLSATLSSFLLQENTKLPWIGMIVGLNLIECIVRLNQAHHDTLSLVCVFTL